LYESIRIGKENLPQLQNYPPQGRGSRDLCGRPAQAAPRLIAHVLEEAYGTYRRYQHPAESAL
jgi:hypothetical protein